MYIAYKLPSAGHIQFKDQLQLATLDLLRLHEISATDESGYPCRGRTSGMRYRRRETSGMFILHTYIGR